MRPIWSLATAVAVMALALTACTDSGDDDPGSSTTTGVAAPLIADFAFDVAFHTPPSGFGCIPGEVTFTDRSTGEPTGWQWAFPDGSTSDEQHPRVDFINSGDDVTLTVNRGDQRAEVTKEIAYPVC